MIDCWSRPAHGPGYRLHRDKNGIISGLAHLVGVGVDTSEAVGLSEVGPADAGVGSLMNSPFVGWSNAEFDSTVMVAGGGDAMLLFKLLMSVEQK